MRSFWTKKPKKKEFSFLFYFLIKNGRGREVVSPSWPLLPCACPASWGYLTIAIVLVNV